jgi:transposase
MDDLRRCRLLWDPSFPDTVSKVIHPTTRRARKSAPQESVNNFAAPVMKSSEKDLRSGHSRRGRIALGGSRSFVSHPTRIQRSLPARPAASVSTSERTIAREAPGIRSTHDGATMQRKTKPMKLWQDLTHYAGFDWAKDHHAVLVLNQQGQVVADFEFEHSLEGWKSFAEKTSVWPNLAVAIETSQGAVVDQLLQKDYTVYPVHPVAAQSYRERKAPSGTKTDHLDAWALADALRVDGQGWKILQPMDPMTQQLRLLCRDEVVLIEQRTAMVNQLQQALLEYYPAALEAFDDWTDSFTWEFILAFPTPQALVQAGKRRWEKFLHTHKLWRPETAEKRLKLFAQADQFKASDPMVRAKSQLAVCLAKLLCTLAQQLKLYRKQIEALFRDHPDHDLFGSLPGAKKMLAPRLLGAVGGDPERYGSHEVLQCIAGTAPVSYQSGKLNKVHVRWACDKFLRHTIHLWADCFRKASAWGQTYYQQKRQEGMTHACALRCLGQRLLKILYRMLVTRKPYDGELHSRNQQKHGSWVLSLVNKPAVQTSE